MQAHISLNGSKTQKGNYVWGGALTLAWKQLCKDIIKEPIKVQSDNPAVLQIVQNFNKTPFNDKMLSSNCYYACAGFGNETVNKINEQVSKKFPSKTTKKIEANLKPDSIISYAYFLKLMKFQHPFVNEEIEFNGKMVPGFEAKNPSQRKQILAYDYKDQDNFTIKLITQSDDDEIFLIKSKKEFKHEQILEKVNNLGKLTSIGSKDIFRMPKVSLSHNRTVNELVGVSLANKNFERYFFDQIYEIIKLDIDEKGVKVQNEGVIKMTKSKALSTEQIRRFVLDKPFWIAMRQDKNHPYFIAYICEVQDK